MLRDGWPRAVPIAAPGTCMHNRHRRPAAPSGKPRTFVGEIQDSRAARRTAMHSGHSSNTQSVLWPFERTFKHPRDRCVPLCLLDSPAHRRSVQASDAHRAACKLAEIEDYQLRSAAQLRGTRSAQRHPRGAHCTATRSRERGARAQDLRTLHAEPSRPRQVGEHRRHPRSRIGSVLY
jgi:hypothetical protein